MPLPQPSTPPAAAPPHSPPPVLRLGPPAALAHVGAKRKLCFDAFPTARASAPRLAE